MHKPSSALRKAAILVVSLDSASADALLDQMPTEQATLVRQAVLDLGPIDPTEQQQIIGEFLGRKQAIADPGGVELDASLVRKFSTAAVALPASKPSTDVEPAPFGCLHEATGESLAKLLQREHPQTVALVVAHLPPARASEIVARLPAPFQATVLRRVADLDETSPEVIRELEQSLANLLAEELRAGRRRTAGLAAVGAILGAASVTARDAMLSGLALSDADLAARLTLREPSPVEATTEEWATDDDEHSPDDTEIEDPETDLQPSPPVVAFDDFSQFNNAALAAVLKAADPRIAILALTGAPQVLVDRLLKQLPRQEAQALRSRLEQSGPLRLRDVETAQRQLALMAGRLAAQGKLSLPAIRRFATAA